MSAATTPLGLAALRLAAGRLAAGRLAAGLVAATYLAACGAPPVPRATHAASAAPSAGSFEAPRLPVAPEPPAAAARPIVVPRTLETTLDGGVTVSVASVPGDLAAVRITLALGLATETTPGILRAALGQRLATAEREVRLEIGPDATTVDVTVLARDLPAALADLGDGLSRHRRSARGDAWLAAFVRDPASQLAMPLVVAAAIDPDASATQMDARKLTPAAIDVFARTELAPGRVRVAVASPLDPEAVVAHVRDAFVVAGRAAPPTPAGRPVAAQPAPPAPASTTAPRFLLQPGRPGRVDVASARLVSTETDATALAAILVAAVASPATRPAPGELRLVRVGPRRALVVETTRGSTEVVAFARATLAPNEATIDVERARRAARALFEAHLADPREVVAWLDAGRSATPPFELAALAAALDSVSADAVKHATRAVDQATPVFVVRGALDTADRSALGTLGTTVDVAPPSP